MATKADLDVWGLQAERHWLRHRPKAVKALKAKGQLYDALVEAQENAERTYQDQWKAGLHPMEAKEIAMYEWILLPDIGGEDDEEDDEA